MVSGPGVKASQKVVMKATELLLGFIIDKCENRLRSIITYEDIWDEAQEKHEFAEWDKRKFHHALENLRKNGSIVLDRTNGSIEYTNKAQIKMIDHFANQRLGEDCYRFVSFDIPEVLRKRRDAFRRAIKRMGFIQIQKSLWVTDKDVGDLIELAAYEYKIENYVVYMVSARSDIDGIIKKKLQRSRD